MKSLKQQNENVKNQENGEYMQKNATPLANRQKLDFLLKEELSALSMTTLHSGVDISTKEITRGKDVFLMDPTAHKHLINHTPGAPAPTHQPKVDFSYRHTCYRKIYELVQNSEIGKVHSVSLTYHDSHKKDKTISDLNHNVGCVANLGFQLLDLVLWTLDFPAIKTINSRLYAKDQLLVEHDKQEDHATVDLHTVDKTSIHMSCSCNLKSGANAFIQVVFYGTQGSAIFKNVGGSIYDFVAKRNLGASTITLAGPSDDWGNHMISEQAKRQCLIDQFTKESSDFSKVENLIQRIYDRN